MTVKKQCTATDHRGWIYKHKFSINNTLEKRKCRCYLRWRIAGMVFRRDNNQSGAPPHEANEVDQLLTMKRSLTEGHTIFSGIFEDVIAPAAIPADTNRRIFEAPAALPSDNDMLYLEYCSEDCDRVRSSPRPPRPPGTLRRTWPARPRSSSPSDPQHGRRSPVWDAIGAM